MCAPRVEAHHEAMFTNYEITTALVNERQATLRHEASQHRLGRSARRARRSSTEVRPVRSVSQADRLPAVQHNLPESVAA